MILLDITTILTSMGMTMCVSKNVHNCGEKELTKLIKKPNGNIEKLTLCQWPGDNAQLFASIQNKLTQIK